MKKLAILLLFSSLFLMFSACDKNKDQEPGSATLTLDFNFLYGDLAFELNQVYQDYPLEYDLKIENLKLYFSELNLIDVDGNRHQFSEILFVNSADSINSFSFTIPALQYKSIEYSIGVPQAMNGTDNENFDAALYSPSHPLSLSNGMYWTWNSGYRFVLIDGRCNTDPTVDDEFETLVSIHTGKDYCYRTKSVPISLNPVEDGLESIQISIDVHGFFSSSEDVIDLAIDNQSHGTNESLANRVSDNVKLSITPN